MGEMGEGGSSPGQEPGLGGQEPGLGGEEGTRFLDNYSADTGFQTVPGTPQRNPSLQSYRTPGSRTLCGVSRRSCHKICLYAVIAILSVLLIICVPFIFHKTNGGNTCPVAEKRPRCPNNNWIMDNRTCYLISKTKETYASSQNICLSYNATLAVLKDNNKKESVIKYTKEEDLWVGLEKDGGIWRWPDFTPLSPEEVENDAPELMCAILHSHYGALDCSSPRRFICMRDAD